MRILQHFRRGRGVEQDDRLQAVRSGDIAFLWSFISSPFRAAPIKNPAFTPEWSAKGTLLDRFTLQPNETPNEQQY